MGNLGMVLIDTCYKILFAKYSSKLAGRFEFHNDLYVILCSYLLFCMTEFSPTRDMQIFAGWLFIGSIGAMFVVNIVVLLFLGARDAIRNLKLKFVRMQNLKRHQKSKLKS